MTLHRLQSANLGRRELMLGAGALSLLGVAGCATTAGAAAPKTDDASLQAAFYYAFPLYEFARTAQERTRAVDGSPGTLNTVAHRAQLQDHTSRQVTAPNNDTIYSSAFLELSGGPVELFAPTDTKRYFNIAFMDAFTDNFAYIGTRATKGVGGKFWVVGPQWSGAAPAGVSVIRSSTNDVWMLARILVDGPQDIAAAQALQKQIALSSPMGRPAPKPFLNRTANVADPANFLAVVNEMLARSPGGRGELARASKYAGQGIGGGSPDAATLAAWGGYIPKGLAALREAFLFRDLVVDGWSYQERGVGNFGKNDRLRSAVALGGLAALGEEEAMYFHANFGPDGQRLDGKKKYRWKVPAGGVPADAFWSLTMYKTEPDGRFFLTENPISRYSVGDRTPGLVVNPDGGFEILIQHEKPEGPLAANWLPSPDGPMRLALRAYLPRRILVERKWRVPPLVEVRS